MSLNCKKAEEYLVDYLYQELPAKKTLEVEKHLRDCSQCKSTLESWRAIHRAYQRNAEEPQVAPYTKQKILAVAEEELLRKPAWSERFLWGIKLATVPIAIFILVLFLNYKDQPEVAMHKAEPEAPPAPAVQSEPAPAAVLERRQNPERAKEKLEAPELESKRVEQRSTYAADRLSSTLGEEERADKDAVGNEKKDVALYGSRDEAAPSSAPAAAPPMESVTGQAEMYDQSAGQKAAKMSRASSEADQPFQEAQVQLRKNNVREGKELISKAVELDDRKELASQLHQEGTSYQNRGEYLNAIVNFENVQSNYRNYARMDDVLLRLGDSYAELGQFENAVKAYSQVRGQQQVARERIQRLQKKQQATEQLKALGYVSEPPKKD